MASFREELKAKTAAALMNKTAAGSRVFTMRSLPVRAPDTPAIRIYTTAETGQGYGPHGPPSFRRVLTLTIEVFFRAKSDADLDQAVDAMIADVERALLQNAAWVRLSEDIEAIGVSVEHSQEGDRRHAGLTIQMGVVHRTVHEPLVDDDLETVDIDVQPVGADDDSAFDPNVRITFEHED